ncbi:MAG: hypothetical protein IID42_04800 [Planctomycetes bacterium]|nr:hypothetical protein [Planctomycetota bacterium]
MASQSPKPRCLVVPLLCTLALLMFSGCSLGTHARSRGWVADYDTAESRIERTGRELLIYYKGTRRGNPDRTAEALNERAVKKRTGQYVRCRLFKSYEPDRRYVAQFGVERAPALIIVHRDGTYHSQTGSMSAEAILAFLDEADAPGLSPVLSPHIPRRVAYRWYRTLDAARAQADRLDRPILFVFHRWLSRDWPNLKKLLRRPEVHSRFAGMVHCRLSSLFPAWRKEAQRLGAQNWPALVIARPDGTTDVLELPTSYEQIVHFADGRRELGEDGGGLPATVAASP